MRTFDCSLCTIADSLFLPQLSIFSAAYLFEDVEHMDKAMNSGIMAELLDRAAADSGVRVLDN